MKLTYYEKLLYYWQCQFGFKDHILYILDIFKGLLTKNGKCALLYMIANSFTTKYDDPMTETKNCSLYKNYCDQKNTIIVAVKKLISEDRNEFYWLNLN